MAIHTIRYERACIHENPGHTTRARREFEKLYADDPAYKHVEERLGV